MTGPSGNRLSICPLRFKIASPRVPIDLGFALVNRNSWGGDPESQGANRSAYYPRGQSLFVSCNSAKLKRRVWRNYTGLIPNHPIIYSPDLRAIDLDQENRIRTDH